jgi:putative PIN family toxin of toxin-antitoxin system
VLFDTNILVSSLITPTGNTATVLGLLWRNRLVSYYTSEIYAEYTNVLFRKKFEDLRDDVVPLLRRFVAKSIVMPQPFGTTKLVDEKDEIFYDAAKFYGLTLITGNIKDFPPASFIMTPAEFLRRFNF